MSTNLPLFKKTALEEAFAALRKDLISEDGPRISTMRNYRFAIVQYEPAEEFSLRSEVQKLSSELAASGWLVLSINLQKVFLDRIRKQGDHWIQRVSEMEQQMFAVEPQRGLNYLKTKISPLVEGPTGIAEDCSEIISKFIKQRPDKADRTITIIGRAGSLYPFFRSSALLKHLDGKTGNVPVILLYPGERRGATGLSFMGVLNPDNDYRPRIYP